MTPEEEMEALKGQTRYFQDAIEKIRNRIRELEAAVDEGEQRKHDCHRTGRLP
jgi:hypothetical protein